MFKLNGRSKDGAVKFEQIFEHYELMREKEKELIQRGMLTVVTPMNKEQVTSYPETIIEQIKTMYSNGIVN